MDEINLKDWEDINPIHKDIVRNAVKQYANNESFHLHEPELAAAWQAALNRISDG